MSKKKIKFTKLKYSNSLTRKNIKKNFSIKKNLKKNLLLIFKYIKSELNIKRKNCLKVLIINFDDKKLKMDFNFSISIFLKNFLKIFYKDFILGNFYNIKKKFLKKAKKILEKIKKNRFEVNIGLICNSDVEELFLEKEEIFLRNKNLPIYFYERNDNLKILVKKLFFDLVKKNKEKNLFEMKSYKLDNKLLKKENSEEFFSKNLKKSKNGKFLGFKENISSIKKLGENKKKNFPGGKILKIKRFKSKFLLKNEKKKNLKLDKFSKLKENEFYLFPKIKEENDIIKFEELSKKKISRQIKTCSKLIKLKNFRNKDFFNFIDLVQKIDKVKDNKYNNMINCFNTQKFDEKKNNSVYNIFKYHKNKDFVDDEKKVVVFKNFILQNQKKINKSFDDD